MTNLIPVVKIGTEQHRHLYFFSGIACRFDAYPIGCGFAATSPKSEHGLRLFEEVHFDAEKDSAEFYEKSEAAVRRAVESGYFHPFENVELDHGNVIEIDKRGEKFLSGRAAWLRPIEGRAS